MADCGATGSALDRTVRAMAGNVGPGGRDATKVLGSMVGQTSFGQQQHQQQVMPRSAPHTLVMPPYNLSMPEYLHAPAHQQQHLKPPPAVQAPHQQQQPHPQTIMQHHPSQHQQHFMQQRQHHHSPQMNPYMQAMQQQEAQQQPPQ